VRTSLVAFATFAGLTVGLFATLPLAGTAQGQGRSPTIGVNEIKEGMKGYGLTVFKGTTPEKFDVEVIGVLHNFRPGQDLILVKTPHPRLNITKNVKGMSGSPIYLDGRLAGAYAYSLSSFQTEPVAGVTPIAPMLTELQRAIPPGFWPLEGGAPLPGGARPEAPARPPHAALTPTSFDGAPGHYDLLAHAAQIADRLGATRAATDPSHAGIVPAATPLLVSGMGDRSIELARKLFGPLGLEPMQAGGGQGPIPADAPLHYVDGGSLGVQLARGDVSFMGLGTVTHVQGTKLCGFGHPMMNAGDSALPTTIGRVLWIYASDQHSFKVGESLRPLGALVQDRQSAVVADETKVAPMFPVHVEVQGVDTAPRKVWNMEVADERFMSPSLTASMLSSVVEATISDHRDLTWQMHSKITVRGHAPVEVDDFGVAIGGMPEAGEWSASRAVRVVGDALNNPWESTRIEKVESVLKVQYTRDLWRLRGIELLDEVVDAGQKARIVVHLRPFAGPETVKTLEVTMPLELAGKDVELEVLPGYEVSPELAAPENLSELLANEPRQSAMPRSLVVQFRIPSQGVTFRGHVAPRLPDFALDALRPAHNSVGPDPFMSYSRTVVPLDRYVEGRDRVKVKVRPVVR
jgi:hypothetical protein